MHIEVIRPFRYERRPQSIGAVLEVGVAFGREMIAAGKAIEADAPKPKVEKPAAKPKDDAP